jgi:hypothetical protein
MSVQDWQFVCFILFAVAYLAVRGHVRRLWTYIISDIPTDVMANHLVIRQGDNK